MKWASGLVAVWLGFSATVSGFDGPTLIKVVGGYGGPDRFRSQRASRCEVKKTHLILWHYDRADSEGFESITQRRKGINTSNGSGLRVDWKEIGEKILEAAEKDELPKRNTFDRSFDPTVYYMAVYEHRPEQVEGEKVAKVEEKTVLLYSLNQEEHMRIGPASAWLRAKMDDFCTGTPSIDKLMPEGRQ